MKGEINIKFREEVDKHLSKGHYSKESSFVYVEVDDVYDILDSIESDVIDIYNILRDIEVLSEISDAKKLLEILSLKLY